MPQYRDIYIVRDRQRYGASYFVEEGQLSIGSAYGSKSVPLGRRKPEVAAEKLLVEIVDSWCTREKARLAAS